ncbi:hypothetical protein WN944_003056 [Citrus x changshan-huyou]|uniref:Protein kinase domain-containing protein n=1 Tax=Citrus x changshan-huyou TaxID=2935761 RepID=A0AAP0QT00_9ROSI
MRTSSTSTLCWTFATRRICTTEGIFSESESKPIMPQLFQSISHITRPTSSIHNLKPKNTVKISDFGSAHIIGGLKKTFFFFK